MSNLQEIKTLTREQLITETTIGSLIAYANFETSNYRLAINIILKDEELTKEVCDKLQMNRETLEAVMTADVSNHTLEIARYIGQTLILPVPSAW
jgi:predicted  nucleic acid-binding Zn ribbon protein